MKLNRSVALSFLLLTSEASQAYAAEVTIDQIDAVCPGPTDRGNFEPKVTACLKLIQTDPIGSTLKASALWRIGRAYFARAYDLHLSEVRPLESAIIYLTLAAKYNSHAALDLGRAHEAMALYADLNQAQRASHIQRALSAYTAAVLAVDANFGANRRAYEQRGNLYGRMCEAENAATDLAHAIRMSEGLNYEGTLDSELKKMRSEREAAISGATCDEKFRPAKP